MMADDNQSSPSSALEEKTTQPQAEEVTEGDSIEAHTGDETTKPQQHNHVSNGFAKSVSETNESPSSVSAEEPLIQLSETTTPLKDDQPENNNNNNCADSLEMENNNGTHVEEEKTYTSQLETCLVVKQVTTETIHNETVSDGPGEGQPSAADAVVEPSTTEVSVALADSAAPVESASPLQDGKEHLEKLVDLSLETVTPMKSLDIPTPTDEEGDGFVPLAECLPHEDEPEHEQNTPENDTPAELHKEITNGYGDHSELSPTTSTPEPSLDEKANHPEIEQFVKSGGLKRILPGVQKTEQPYSSCTTETKIAMEIREMREREEELRVMREQALLSPVISPVPPKSPACRSPSPSVKDCSSPTPAGPGYRVSSVFGHKGSVSPSPPIVPEERRMPFKVAATESAVEREIRLAKDREEELRKQKGLPPREDDSYVKPSQVKSSQVRIFGKAVSSVSVKQAATAKIQLEIEEQTQREMALREVGSIQTISQERTDARVTKLTPDCTTPTPPLTNGSSPSPVNGIFSNGRHSPDVAVPYKRSSPSPNGLNARPASIFSQTNGSKGSVNMQKFIASKGKETAFSSPKNGGGFILPPREEKTTAVPPTMVKLKRTVSVESKIQQEIMEMKQREEELKKLHMTRSNGNSNGTDENEREYDMNQKNVLEDFENGNGILDDEDLSPRHNKLIAQWEQRCQKTES